MRPKRHTVGRLQRMLWLPNDHTVPYPLRLFSRKGWSLLILETCCPAISCQIPQAWPWLHAALPTATFFMHLIYSKGERVDPSEENRDEHADVQSSLGNSQGCCRPISYSSSLYLYALLSFMGEDPKGRPLNRHALSELHLRIDFL